MNTAKRRGVKYWLIAIFILAVGYGYWAERRPLALIMPAHSLVQLQPQSPAAILSWPSYGQAAVGVTGTGIIASRGEQKPLPVASVAKIISALCILQQKPLQPGEQGPMVTLTDSDVALYNQYQAQGGSVLPVSSSEQLSEYQLLQAMLLPSANNAADSLASWAFGSLAAYTTYANNYLAKLGLHNTHVGSDASGFSPTTTSTAEDLVKLGELAMQQPALAQIVSQNSAALPLAGAVQNVNALLGTNNIIGIKTGNSDQAGGAYLSASTTIVNGHSLTIVTAFINAPNLWQAMHDSLPLIQSAQANFTNAQVIDKGAVVGEYKLPWGGHVSAAVSQNLFVTTWRGSQLSATIHLQAIRATDHINQKVGDVSVPTSLLSNQQSVPIVLQKAPTKPSFWWRLTHPAS